MDAVDQQTFLWIENVNRGQEFFSLQKTLQRLPNISVHVYSLILLRETIQKMPLW